MRDEGMLMWPRFKTASNMTTPIAFTQFEVDQQIYRFYLFAAVTTIQDSSEKST
jgi:hypothetical protein